jgi:hypothetical protein
MSTLAAPTTTAPPATVTAATTQAKPKSKTKSKNATPTLLFPVGRTGNNLKKYLTNGGVCRLSSNGVKAHTIITQAWVQEVAAAAAKTARDSGKQCITPGVLAKLRNDDFDIACLLGSKTPIPNAPMTEIIPTHILTMPIRRRNKKKNVSPTAAAEASAEGAATAAAGVVVTEKEVKAKKSKSKKSKNSAEKSGKKEKKKEKKNKSSASSSKKGKSSKAKSKNSK